MLTGRWRHANHSRFTMRVAITGVGLVSCLGLDLDQVSEALRQGRFAQAGDRFALISRESPLAAEGPFFEAFLIWWRWMGCMRSKVRFI